MAPVNTDSNRWHVAHWPPLTWLETVLKLGALAFGVLGLAAAISSGRFILPEGARLAQMVLLALLSLGLSVAILDRYIEREIVSMIFIIINNLGHWGMVAYLSAATHPADRLVPFALFMLIGDGAKLLFLHTHRYSVRGRSWRTISLMSSLYVAGYAVLLALEPLIPAK
jgi:hypothetical protein